MNIFIIVFTIFLPTIIINVSSAPYTHENSLVMEGFFLIIWFILLIISIIAHVFLIITNKRLTKNSKLAITIAYFGLFPILYLFIGFFSLMQLIW